MRGIKKKRKRKEKVGDTKIFIFKKMMRRWGIILLEETKSKEAVWCKPEAKNHTKAASIN